MLLIFVFSNFVFAEQVEIDLELLPQMEQEKIKATKLGHYYSDLEEIKIRKGKCLSNKNAECVQHYEQLTIKLQQDLESAKSNLGQSDDWRYGLPIELLIKSIPKLANYQVQFKCKSTRALDAFYFERTNENQEYPSVSVIGCRSKNRVAYCDLSESDESIPYGDKLNGINYDQLVKLWKRSPEKVSFIKDSDYLYDIEVYDSIVKFTLSNSACDGPSHWMRYKLSNVGSESMQLIFQSEGAFTK